MKKIFFCRALTFILLLTGCCNDNLLPTSENILKGKLKTFEDENFTSSITNDSAVRFYFNYDSIHGELKNISIKIQINNMDTMLPVFTINKVSNGITYVYFLNFYSLGAGIQKFRINTINKRITSLVELDTINNTERLVTYTYYTGNNIDSAYNAGDFLTYNIRLSNFIFSNQNFIGYNINSTTQLISPPYNTINRQAHRKINYTNSLLKNKLFTQNCMDIFPRYNYDLLLYFLNVDDYYITPINKNLISDITEFSENDDDTIIVRYNYQYTYSDVTSVKRTYFSLSDTSIKTEKYQRMTYY